MVVRARKETDWTSLSFVKTFSPLSSELKEHLVLEVKCLHVESLSFQATKMFISRVYPNILVSQANIFKVESNLRAEVTAQDPGQGRS